MPSFILDRIIKYTHKHIHRHDNFFQNWKTYNQREPRHGASESIIWCFMIKWQALKVHNKANWSKWLWNVMWIHGKLKITKSLTPNKALASVNLKQNSLVGLQIANCKQEPLLIPHSFTWYSLFVTQGELSLQGLSFGHCPIGL